MSPEPFVTSSSRAGSRRILHLELESLSSRAKDALFDRLAEHAMPHVIDRFVRSWSAEGAAEGSRETGSFYLTLERVVL